MKVKQIFIIVLALISMNTYGQKEDKIHAYFAASFDPNQTFGIIDNPRTKIETYGFDYDLEAGARFKQFGIYLMYGAFQEIGYQNLVYGADFYFLGFDDMDPGFIKEINLSVGLNHGPIWRRDHYGVWGGKGNLAARVIGTLWIFDNIGLTGKIQYQQRKDLKIFGIVEVNAGLIFRIKRKFKINRLKR